MGELAQHVAESVRRRHPDHVASGDAEALLTQMGRVAGQLAGAAEQVLRTRNPEEAAELAIIDDDIDCLHRQILALVVDRAWTGGITCAIDVALLSRFYERFGDHAVEVGRRVIFLVTGERVLQ